MLVIADIKNKLFKQFDTATQQEYVDLANDEVEDLAKQFIGEDAIATPWHFRLIRYGVFVALSEFAVDNADFNNDDGYSSEDDAYTKLYNRAMYKRQQEHAKISKVCFSDDTETPTTRAVASVRLVRG